MDSKLNLTVNVYRHIVNLQVPNGTPDKIAYTDDDC